MECREEQVREERQMRKVQVREVRQSRGVGSKGENKPVREANRAYRFIPGDRDNEYQQDETYKQKDSNWKVFDVDWEENFISEHEGNWEDISHRDHFFDPPSKFFAEAEERDRILCSQNWFFDSHPFYLQPWYPNFDPTQLAIYDKPLWVHLYNLPSEYWSNPCLECIGRTLGTLLEIDEAIIDADLYIYARIKIAVVKEISPSISIITNEGSWYQQVEIEKDITSCARCGSRRQPIGRCRMFIRSAFKKPPNKSGNDWNHMPLANSKLPLLIGPISANIDPPPKELSQDNGNA
ncbi:hypothetical protein SUGI_0535980 [Cryptomeria japonica]|nr:hypothetical protein SUGI_0535980 [Cryptomeria japonica]